MEIGWVQVERLILYFYLLSILIDIKNLNRRSYKGLDDYGGNIAVGDGYYNDAYEDEESKLSIESNQNEYHFYMMKTVTFFYQSI